MARPLHHQAPMQVVMRWGSVLAFALTTACASTAGDPGAGGETGICEVDCTAGGEETSDDDAGGDEWADGAGDDGDDGLDDGSDDGGAMDDLPCAVRDALIQNCMPCHDDPPIYGAPMALRDYEDLHVPAVTDAAVAVYDMVGQRLVDADNPMPPGGDIEDADRDVLLDWIEAGAPKGSCGEPDPEPDDGPEVGPDALPCEPTTIFTAHAQGSETDAFHVPEVGADNLYECFTFHSPLTEDTQATAWAPIVDDERVLHHWILYRTAEEQTDGGVGPCNMPGDATFVAGWAPGGENFEMPEDVGLELGGPQDYYILQIHYHNTAQYPDAFDRSGVALCTAEEPRPQTAGIFTLGTVGINIPAGAQNYAVDGTCPSWITNYLTAPLHVMASFPHMHELGRSLRTDVLRGGVNGPIENLVDVPNFDFQSQSFYPHDPELLIQPGDAIRTTCAYDNDYGFDVTFGEATEDEMCFNFVMVYPIELVGDYRKCGLLG